MSMEEAMKDSSKYMNPPEEDLLTESIKDNAEKIADILYRGKDVEIRKSRTGISIAEVSKKVVAK